MDSQRSTKPLREALLDTVATVRAMDKHRLATLLNFVGHSSDKFFFDEVEARIRAADGATVVQYVEGFLRSDASVMALFPPDTHPSVVSLVRLTHLQWVLNGTSAPQTQALHRALVPPLATTPGQRYQILIEMQRLLRGMQPNNLGHLHNMFQDCNPDDEKRLQDLRQALQLRPEGPFWILRPFLQLLYLDTDELKALREAFITFNTMHLTMIANLMGLPNTAPLEFRGLFCVDRLIDDFGAPGFALGLSGEQLRMDVRDSSDEGEDTPVQTMRLEIVEQPPQKCVYRRNLKPAPVVNVVGIEGRPKRLFVATKVIRCDKSEEIDNESAVSGLTSDLVQRVIVGHPVTFDKIKVGITSHQLDDSYLVLQFELREYEEDSDEIFKCIHSVQSVPFQVVAHSNQMKKPSQLPPEVQELIPAQGSVRGGTQVVVLGNNFFDSPGLRVRFGQQDVQPHFHGPRTLVCRSPPNVSEGSVAVAVSNDGRKFGIARSNSFTYSQQADPGQRMPGPLSSSHNVPPAGIFELGMFDDMPPFVDLTRSTDMMRISADGLDNFFLSNSFDGQEWEHHNVELKHAFDLSSKNNEAPKK